MKLKEFFALARMRFLSKTKSKDGATLGVMPDYGYKGQGMRIDRISAGKTAEKYGLREDDIVIKIGRNEVKDLMGYMSVLMKYSVGDKASIFFIRGNEEMMAEIRFLRS